MVQDHVKPELMFAATEFGVFFTVDGGDEWIQLKGGAPVISFRDITIQREHEDLVAASFGRGFFILDDYSPLREVSEETLNEDGVLFPTRDAFWYIPRNEVASQGDDQYVADNPPFGAVFTYHLKESHLTQEQERQRRERELEEDENVPFPGWDALDAEIAEEAPYIMITIKDEGNRVVNRVKGPAREGFHRVNWELRHASKDLIDPESSGNRDGFSNSFPVVPGTYFASMSLVKDGDVQELSDEISFDVVPLREGALDRKPDETREAFMENLIAFQQDLSAVSSRLEDAQERIAAMRAALIRADNEDPELLERLHDARMKLLEFDKAMNGSDAKGQIGEKEPPTPRSRLFVGFRALGTTYGPTATYERTVEAGKSELEAIRRELDAYLSSEMPALERALEAAGAPPIDD